MGRTFGIITLFLILFFFSHSASSAAIIPNPVDTTKYQNDKNLDEVVVTASRTQKFLKDLPVPTQVVGPASIKLIAPRSFIDLLQYSVPGFEFRKHGLRDQLSYRGFDGSSLLFLVDGELITTGSSSDIDFDRINPDNIERIEIIRGAASALYGSNALAGVVNVITKGSKDPFRASQLTFLDSRLNYRSGVNVAFNKGVFGSVTDLGYDREKGYVMEDDEKTKTYVYDVDRINVSQKFTITPTKDVAIKLGGLYNHRTLTKDEYLKFLYGALDLKGGVVWNFADNQSIDVSYHFSDFRRDTLLTQSQNNPRRVVFKEQMHHARAQYNLDMLDKHSINLGGEYIFDVITSPRLESPADPGPKDVQTGVLYGQYAYAPIDELTLSYGGRLDMRTDFGAHYTNRATVKFRPTEEFILRASFAQGYRTPSMQELFFFFDHFGMFHIFGNKHLKPEKSNMMMLTLEYNLPKLNIAANAFYNHVTNRIAMMQKEGNYYYVNAPRDDKGKVFGFDFNVHATLPLGFSARASYAFTHDYYALTDKNGTAIKDADGQTAVTTLTRPHTIVGMLAWEQRFGKNYSISANVAVRYLSGFTSNKTDRQNALKSVWYNPATLAKLGINQRIYQDLELYLGIDNLFNYRPNKLVFNSPVTPGRSYTGSVRITF